MRCRHHLTVSIAALAVALFFATTALANGEPKTKLQFAAGVAQNSSAPDWFERYAAAHPYGRNLTRQALSSVAGAPKNALPFTRIAARTNPGPDVFERYAAAHPYGANLSATTSTVAPSRGGRCGSRSSVCRGIGRRSRAPSQPTRARNQSVIKPGGRACTVGVASAHTDERGKGVSS